MYICLPFAQKFYYKISGFMSFYSGRFGIGNLVEHTKSLNCISRRKIRGIKSHIMHENTFPTLLDENTLPASLPN